MYQHITFINLIAHITHWGTWLLLATDQLVSRVCIQHQTMLSLRGQKITKYTQVMEAAVTDQWQQCPMCL